MKNIILPEGPKLNLVALMDIFTILVFFLMVNSSDVEVMQSDAAIKLPQAYAEAVVGTTLKMSIIDDALIVQGRKILDISSLQLTQESIPALQTELQYQASKRAFASDAEQQAGRAITLFADQDVPYEVLRLILATCAAADYRDVSLAVDKAPVQEVTSV